LCLDEREDPRNLIFFSLLQINILLILWYYVFKYYFKNNYVKIRSGCVTRPMAAVGPAYKQDPPLLGPSVKHDSMMLGPAAQQRWAALQDLLALGPAASTTHQKALGPAGGRTQQANIVMCFSFLLFFFTG
jgi:hypothetical protein